MLRAGLISICFLLILQVLPGQSFPRLEFQKFYGTENNEVGTSIVRARDSTIVIGGNTEEPESKGNCTDIKIMKLTPEGEVVWERTIGGTGCEELRDMTVATDSGIIFVGLTGSFIDHPEKGNEAYGSDYFVGKINKKGDLEWIRAYGGLDADQAFGIARGGKDEYMVAGAANSHNFDVETHLDATNLFVLKLNDFGTKRAGYIFGGERHDWAYSVGLCQNGDYLFAGFTSSTSIDGAKRSNGDGWVMRMSPFGRVIWERVFSGKFEDYFSSVIEDKDGKIVLTGIFESETKGKQWWFLKLDEFGKKIFEKTFGAGQDEYSTSIIQASDGKYIMTGFSKYTSLHNQYILGGEDFWLLKLDFNGDILWQQSFGGRDNERAMDIIEYEPGVFYALGTKYNDFEKGGTVDKKNDFWLLKVHDQECEGMPLDVYLSLKDYSSLAGKSFKCRAIASKGEEFLWDFGDGKTSRKRDPSHAYAEPGVYEIKLTVFINQNCKKTFTVPELIMVW